MLTPPVTYTYRLVHVVMNSDDEAAVAEEHSLEQFIGDFSDGKGFFSDWPVEEAAARCTEFLEDKTHLLVALMEIRQWKKTTLIGSVHFFPPAKPVRLAREQLKFPEAAGEYLESALDMQAKRMVERDLLAERAREREQAKRERDD